MNSNYHEPQRTRILKTKHSSEQRSRDKQFVHYLTLSLLTCRTGKPKASAKRNSRTSGVAPPLARESRIPHPYPCLRSKFKTITPVLQVSLFCLRNGAVTLKPCLLSSPSLLIYFFAENHCKAIKIEFDFIKIQIFFLIASFCGPPPLPSNAAIRSESTKPTSSGYSKGTVILYTCKPGYQRLSGLVLVKCLGTTWTKLTFTCVGKYN